MSFEKVDDVVFFSPHSPAEVQRRLLSSMEATNRVFVGVAQGGVFTVQLWRPRRSRYFPRWVSGSVEEARGGSLVRASSAIRPVYKWIGRVVSLLVPFFWLGGAGILWRGPPAGTPMVPFVLMIAFMLVVLPASIVGLLGYAANLGVSERPVALDRLREVLDGEIRDPGGALGKEALAEAQVPSRRAESASER